MVTLLAGQSWYTLIYLSLTWLVSGQFNVSVVTLLAGHSSSTLTYLFLILLVNSMFKWSHCLMSILNLLWLIYPYYDWSIQCFSGHIVCWAFLIYSDLFIINMSGQFNVSVVTLLAGNSRSTLTYSSLIWLVILMFQWSHCLLGILDPLWLIYH